jgi:hypothetical protein
VKRIALLALFAVVAAVALRAAYGPGYLGYDAAWSLVWGAELRHGALPAYEAALAPTPHPLANLVAVPLSLTARAGEPGLLWLTFLAFGVLVVAGGVLGRQLGGWAGAVPAAALLATRSDLGREAAFASVDVPFLALVVCAVALAAGRERGSAAPLWVLLGAGLLRPEGWGLAVVAWAWAATAPRTTRGRALGLAALALAAPALWLLSDLVVTGDALHSLHGTRALAETLHRPRGAGTALRSLDEGMRSLVGGPLVLAGLIGAAVALVRGRREPVTLRAAAAALAVVVLGVAGFVLLGAAGLPVLYRYLLAPAALLLVLAGGGFGAALRSRGLSDYAGAAAILALVAVSVAPAIDDHRAVRDFTALRSEVHGDLRAAVGSARFRETARGCPVVVPGFRARPFVLLDTGGAPERVRVGNLPDGRRGLLVTYADESSERIFNLGAPGEAPRQAPPLHSRRLAENRSWRVYAVC